MSKKIISTLMSARTTKSIAITLCLSLLLVMIVSLAACSTTAPILSLSQKSAQPLAQPAFKVRDLAVSPVTVNRGEIVTIIANVINTGGSTGPYTAELKINNAIVASKTLDIPSGMTQTLNFTVPASSQGTYEATFGDLSGRYTVADKSAVIQPSNIVGSATSVPDVTVPSAGCCAPPTANLPAINSSAAASASCCAPPAAPAPTSSGLFGLPKINSPGFGGGGGGGCCGR